MIKGISDKTPLTIFNNLSARSDQEWLLAFAQGASIERFGLNDTISRAPTFAADILPYIDAIGRHNDRTFLVFGRAPRSERLTRRTTRTGDGSGISTARICLPPGPTRDGNNTPGS